MFLPGVCIVLSESREKSVSSLEVVQFTFDAIVKLSFVTSGANIVFLMVHFAVQKCLIFYIVEYIDL